MKYFKEKDLDILIRKEEIRDAMDEDDSLLEEVEQIVLGEISTYIGAVYNLEPYFNNTKESYQLRNIAIKLLNYYVFERILIYDELNYKRYKDIIALLEKIQMGKIELFELDKFIDNTTGQTGSSLIEWDSTSYDFFR